MGMGSLCGGLGYTEEGATSPEMGGMFITPPPPPHGIENNWFMLLACVCRVMDARGKFEEHERSVRVARGAAERNSRFLSALQTSQRTLRMNQLLNLKS